jgi:hypothetical protein
MKAKFTFFLFLLFISNLYAASPRIPYGVYIYDGSTQNLERAKEQKAFVIDHLSDSGFELYGEEAEIQQFIDKNQLFALPLSQLERKVESYPSYQKITEELQNLAKNHPQFFKLMSIGKSVKGKELWVMKVSDSVELDEVEPEIKLVANMHGDEIVGRELMILFLKDLAQSYLKKDPRVTKLIQETELYVMPSLNPDGAELKRRGNASYVDLNRDFPDFTTSDNQNTWSKRAPETMSMMKFQAERNFILSANFHGGAVVVNYPWDTSEQSFPLEELVIDLSLSYAKENQEMYSSSAFSQGIVNGYDWYEVDGGMQDWSYYWHQDLQVTVELSDDKWPNYSYISSYYQKNKFSILSFLENVYSGVGFKFNSVKHSGQVEIIDLNREQSLGSYAFSRGEFYKVLPSSRYLLKIYNSNKILMEDLEVTVDEKVVKTFYEQL